MTRALAVVFLAVPAFSQSIKQPPAEKKIPALEELKKKAALGEASKSAPLSTAEQAQGVNFDKRDGSKETKVPVQAQQPAMGQKPAGVTIEDEPQQDDDEGGPADQLKKMLLQMMKDPEFNKEVDQFLKNKVDVAKDHALSDPKVKKLQKGIDNLTVKGIAIGIGLLMAVIGFAVGAPIVGAVGAGIAGGLLITTGISWLTK